MLGGAVLGGTALQWVWRGAAVRGGAARRCGVVRCGGAHDPRQNLHGHYQAL